MIREFRGGEVGPQAWNEFLTENSFSLKLYSMRLKNGWKLETH